MRQEVEVRGDVGLHMRDGELRSTEGVSKCNK
jgi:hypothetical protein